MESLVGKDEVFIVEKLHCMVRNEERVKVQDDIIKNLESEIDDSKEEIHFLKTKLDQKYDIIDDMERELNKFDDLEKETRKKDDIIKSLQYGIASKLTMIDDLMLIRKENEEESNKLNNKICIQNNVIKELKESLKENDKISTDEEEIDKLLEEIKHLKITNREKEKVLEKVQSENDVLNDLHVVEFLDWKMQIVWDLG